MFKIITNKPVAIDSPDHLMPFGCIANSSTNSRFNKKLYNLFNHKISILDLGCAGGGFVAECIRDGHTSVGIEGSDLPLIRQLSEWPNIPNNLFTSDVTSEFQILYDNKPMKFDCITSWEMLEHICEEDLPTLFSNIIKHLKPDGLVIVSINVATKAHAEYALHSEGRVISEKGGHHQNVQPIEWWDDKFREYKFHIKENLRRYFKPDWIRGPGHGCCPNATEERYNIPNLPASMQWATINRVLALNEKIYNDKY